MERGCYPIQPLWLTDLLPDYDIIATDRQQLVVGQRAGGRKTLFEIQSADYTIIPNQAIREVVDEVIPDYRLLIKPTNTSEFSICIILPASLSVDGERLLNVPASCRLMYNAVNYALFTGRSSLTLNDRYCLDERVFHHLAAHTFARPAPNQIHVEPINATGYVFTRCSNGLRQYRLCPVEN